MSTRTRLGELKYLIEKLLESHDALSLVQPANPVDTFYLGKITEWTNKIHGVSSGYASEFQEMYKHRTVKGRAIYGGYADVSVGEPTDLTSKSVQVKSTNQDKHSVVNSMISEAANQLTGERGELPRPGDRLVIDMSILNANNLWPLSSRGIGLTIDDLERVGGAQLCSLIMKYTPHVVANSKASPPQPGAQGHGMSAGQLMSFTDMKDPTLISRFSGHSNVRSTQYIHTVSTMTSVTHVPALHLTVKIRYKEGYVLKHNNGSEYIIRLAVFNLHRQGNQLVSKLVKYT